MKKVLYIVLFLPIFTLAQDKISGMIMETNSNKEDVPLAGANVYWLNTTIGDVTDLEGKFTIPYKKEYTKLVISFVGYKTDTLDVTAPKFIHHWLQSEDTLEEVNISVRKNTAQVSYLEAQNVLNISSDELLKAACCNLSESFETNPSIDVNFADAVSGTRQIRMLGLTNPYILIATENIPTVRGAAQAYGMSFIPGTWVQSIQVTKGAGSVINGFESIAGQINAELQKPTMDDKLFINAYAGMNARLELNTHFNTKLSNKWSTGLYLHANSRDVKFDKNKDSFLDMPLQRQLNLLNRWQYTDNEKGYIAFLNFRYLVDNKQTGQENFNPKTDKLTTNVWGSEIDTKRFDFSGKVGYVNPDLPWQSIGVQFAVSNHQQESYFGLGIYNNEHNSIYSNAIYSSIISDSRHKIKTGLSFTYDRYDELVATDVYQRTENSVGGFFEYNFDNLEKLNLTAGIRADSHNRLGFFITPRLHVRYTPWEKSALRFSVGRGKRSANIFAENQQMFATSRTININNTEGKIYGLDPEIAWNYGMSFLQGFTLFNRKGNVTADYYRTHFENQVVADWENPQEVNFYNLDGKSFANSLQLELNYNLFENFDLRTAYKFYEVKTDYTGGRLERPLTPKHRIFANASFETNKRDNQSQWKFDATYNWLGKQRFPSTVSNPETFQLPEYSPTVATVNAQVTKVFSKSFEVYLGGENITNVRQKNPILGAQDPFGPYFDSTLVYGPIFGSMYYAGLRFRIE
ncbi:MAG TPA: TonB-dependent receptor [Flavobacteriaceae bacterium]|nr:TonB-dependent receptor [Flavobacteriaceae bacterium]